MMSSQKVHVPFLIFAIPLALAAVSMAEEIAPYFHGDRILINGQINQQPVRFALDTGASFSTLFGPTAERLQVKIESTRTNSIANHPVEFGLSEPLDFAMFGQELRTKARILMSPGPANIDGVLSWRNVSAPILLIDGYERKVGTRQELPTTGWQRWQLEQENSQLFFVVTQEEKPLGRVFVDTGSTSGLRLSPSLWKAWREQNPDAGVTLETFSYVVGNPMVHEMAWTDEYALGDLIFHNVDIGPIPEAGDEQAIDVSGKEFIATIGMRALRHLRLIISQRSGEVLTQSVSGVPNHNRLGAAFVRESEDNPALIGRVLKGSPAERAGLENGDRLLEINGVVYRTNAQQASEHPMTFFSKPAGTWLNIKIERAGAEYEFSVRLQDLLGGAALLRQDLRNGQDKG